MLSNFKRLAFISTLLFWFSCSNDRMAIDPETVKLEIINGTDLDRDLFNMSEKKIAGQTSEMIKKYGTFYPRYISSFLNPGGCTDSSYRQNLLQFIHDKDMKGTYELVQKTYPAELRKKLNNDINASIKRFHYFFPQKTVPKQIVYGLSGYNYAVAFVDSSLFISLDMYLGTDCKFYTMLNWPQYKTRLMSSAYIIPDLMRGWLLSEFDKDMPTNNLLHHMIFYGKLYYATKRLVPEANDSVIIGYTTEQMKYCKAYEKNLWGYMVEKNRLYENNLRTIQELTAEGPFTGAISKECPPGIAKWTGWRIIESYMKNNENISMEELFEEADAQKILNKSKYKP